MLLAKIPRLVIKLYFLNFHGKGKYNDILSNSVIIEWSNVAFEAVGGAAEGHPVLASRNESQ